MSLEPKRFDAFEALLSYVTRIASYYRADLSSRLNRTWVFHYRLNIPS